MIDRASSPIASTYIFDQPKRYSAQAWYRLSAKGGANPSAAQAIQIAAE